MEQNLRIWRNYRNIQYFDKEHVSKLKRSNVWGCIPILNKYNFTLKYSVIVHLYSHVMLLENATNNHLINRIKYDLNVAYGCWLLYRHLTFWCRMDSTRSLKKSNQLKYANLILGVVDKTILSGDFAEVSVLLAVSWFCAVLIKFWNSEGAIHLSDRILRRSSNLKNWMQLLPW